MKRCTLLAGLVAVLVWSVEARASGPIGAYGLIEKVSVEEKKGEAPTVQIWGVFCLATKNADHLAYSSPQQGFLYMKPDADAAELCRRECADLQKIAGTGQIVGFGDSHEVRDVIHVRRAIEKAEKPEPFPLQNGLVKIRDDNEAAAVKDLIGYAFVVEPGDGSAYPKGMVTFSVRNIRDKKHAKAKYVFEAEGAGIDKVKSEPVDAGDKETKWTPKTEFKGGEKYTVRVHAVDGDWKGPMATVTFETKK
jgi:hypothetical protein